MRSQVYTFCIFTMFFLSCFDEIKSSPPCFYEGSEPANSSNEISINACCEPGTEGNSFCSGLFSSEGYMALADLSQCAPA